MSSTLDRLTIARPHGLLVALLAAYVLLGTLYSVTTPFFEASDELWHYPMVKRFADGKGLPVQDPETETEWRQEGGQPPLYYVLMAAPTFWIDTDDLGDLQRYNHHSYIGRADRRGNRNIIIHTARERFPWQGTVLAVHIIRILSVLLQAATVLGIYLLTLEIMPGRRDLALAAASLTAFVPMILFISASVNNDNLIVPIATWTVLLLTRVVKYGPSWRSLSVIALLIGLGGIAKMSGPGLLPLGLIVIAVVARRRRDRDLLFRGGGLLVAGFLLVSGWFYWRNWRLYFDPSGWSVWLQFGQGAREELPWLGLLNEWGSFRNSYWALFGGVNIQVDEWIYTVLDVMTLAAVSGLLLGIARASGWVGGSLGAKARAREVWRLLWVPLLWLALIVLGLSIWTSLIEASQGRLIFPATGAVSILLTYGLSQWLPRRWHGVMAGLLAGGFLGFALLCPFVYIMPAYRQPQPIGIDQLPPDVSPIDVTFGNQIRLLAGSVDPGPYHPRDNAQVTLCWQSLRVTEDDWSVFIHLFGHEGQSLGQTDIYPTLGLRPTSFWSAGEIYCDGYDVPIKRNADVPVLARVEAGLYNYHTANLERLPPVSSAGDPMGQVQIGELKIVPPRWPQYEPAYAADYSLGGTISLVGYDLDRRVHAGAELDCNLYWQVDRPAAEDYTVFTHVMGSDGELWGQWDSQPLGGGYPTSVWAPGETIRDEYDIPVLPDAPPGQYYLEVGMYLLDSGQRLPVSEGGSSIGSRILLGPVEVVE